MSALRGRSKVGGKGSGYFTEFYRRWRSSVYSRMAACIAGAACTAVAACIAVAVEQQRGETKKQGAQFL